MSDTQPQELTPEAKAILARARKSFLFSIGLLIVGVLAVGGALIFRSSTIGGGGGSSTGYSKADGVVDHAKARSHQTCKRVGSDLRSYTHAAFE